MQKKFTDCTLIFRDDWGHQKIIDIHLIILAQRSPYFEKLFSEGFQESTQSEVVLQVDDVETAGALIEWFYQPVDYRFFSIVEFRYLADMWLLRPKECSHYEIETDNYWPLLELSVNLLEARDNIGKGIVDYASDTVKAIVCDIMSKYIAVFRITPEDFRSLIDKFIGGMCPNNYLSQSHNAKGLFIHLINEFSIHINITDPQVKDRITSIISTYLFDGIDPQAYFSRYIRIDAQTESTPQLRTERKVLNGRWSVYDRLLIMNTLGIDSGPIDIAVKSISKTASGYILNDLNTEERKLAKQSGFYTVKNVSSIERFMKYFSIDLLQQVDL